jgi:poly(A) polymerase
VKARTQVDPATHIEPAAWMRDGETRAVFDALAAPARFVGGCVRDLLLGRPVTDIDIATTLPPDAVIARLDRAGIKAVPTGFEHGTVTAVTAHRHFEITTLRIDVRTDGRRAEVAFTDDWAADAARRDFTVNALYCDADGAVYDPVDGLADLRARRIRFVGDPRQRIAEDVLRLLRFFRFQAQFGEEPLDRAGLAACRAAAPQLPSLAGERIWNELRKLLGAPDPATTLVVMSGNGILGPILPDAKAIDRLAALVTVEGIVAQADPLRRLAAMLVVDAAGGGAVAERLRLSGGDRARLLNLVSTERVDPDIGVRWQRAMLYRVGPECWRDRVLIDWADEISRGIEADRRRSDAWRDTFELPERNPPPTFPLRGRDVLALGVAAGPAVGELLAEVERWWIEGDFRAGRTACLSHLAGLARLASSSP